MGITFGGWVCIIIFVLIVIIFTLYWMSEIGFQRKNSIDKDYEPEKSDIRDDYLP